jgi:hypothetical protein
MTQSKLIQRNGILQEAKPCGGIGCNNTIKPGAVFGIQQVIDLPSVGKRSAFTWLCETCANKLVICTRCEMLCTTTPEKVDWEKQDAGGWVCFPCNDYAARTQCYT